MNEDVIHGNEPTRLSPTTVSELLEFGMSGPARPVDDLARRLGAVDGHEWLAGSLAKHLSISQLEELQTARPPAAGAIESLVAIKRQGKALFAAGHSDDERRTGLLIYALAIAAGLRRAGRLLSDQPRSEIDELLVDLADVLPEPWRALTAQAALAGHV